MTFEQMRQMMDEMAQRIGQNQDTDLKFDVSSRETGQTKVIAGLNAKQMILTLTLQRTNNQTGNQGAMIITSDLWLAPAMAGYDEVRNFQRDMASKLAVGFGRGINPMMPGGMRMAKGMAEVAKESAKLDGVALLQTITIQGEGAGTTNSSNSTSQNQTPPSGDAGTSAAESRGGRIGTLGGIAGSLGGFGRRKKSQEQSSNQPAQDQNASTTQPFTSGTLIEMTTKLRGFSSAPVDSTKFETPSGFQQVEAPGIRRGR